MEANVNYYSLKLTLWSYRKVVRRQAKCIETLMSIQALLQRVIPRTINANSLSSALSTYLYYTV